MEGSRASAPAWHALDVEGVLEHLGVTPLGLTTSEASERRARYGPNAVEVRRPTSWGTILRHQFASVVVWLLIVAAAVALAIGDGLEAGAIAVVLAINVGVGFWTEWRARVAVDALTRLQVHEAVVLRDGRRSLLPSAELVPGDVLLLAEGAAVAADARLIEANELGLDEATLTGESMPVSKSVRAVQEEASRGTAIGDRRSMVFKGTTVARGAGRAVVVATGASTELGRIGELVGSVDHGPTPIERRLDALGRRLVWITLAIAGLVFAIGVLGGRDPWLVFETGLALAIAAVPEGLPVVATITLAIGMWRMARRNAVVRRPPAVEALGSATVICADKTGTLTSGRMAATSLLVAGRRIDVTGGEAASAGGLERDGVAIGADNAPLALALIRSAVLANESRVERTESGWEGVGDPTDLALLYLGLKVGISRDEALAEVPEVARMPFSSRRMLMATFHATRSGASDPLEMHVKGAADHVLPLCTHRLGADGPEPLSTADRDELLLQEEAFAAEGLRVLAVARGQAATDRAGTDASLRDLTLLGFVGLMDPPAPHVAETIARFQAAGVRTVMITGDQPVTARAVAERLGMIEKGGRVLPGAEVARMTDAELADAVGEVTVFGRISPEDKLRIVEALQSRGEVVGMLGDGVNDAPALKRADIGVAMGGRGTDVAKEVADLVLTDDRLETVGVAVEEGRVIFDNIRKFVFYLFSCNLSEVGVVLGASLVGAPLPLLPLQLLWLNVVTDVFPALALSAEPAEPDVMRRPPRPKDAPILSRGFLTHLGGYAFVITGVTLGVFAWALTTRSGETEYAVTMAFMTLALAQLTHAFNARGFGPLRLGRALFANHWLWSALALSLALQSLTVQVPGLRRVLGTVPISALDWTIVGAAALAPLLAGQGWKRWSSGRRDQRSRNRSTGVREASGTSS